MQFALEGSGSEDGCFERQRLHEYVAAEEQMYGTFSFNMPCAKSISLGSETVPCAHVVQLLVMWKSALGDTVQKAGGGTASGEGASDAG